MKKHILLLLALCGVQSHAYSNRVPVAKPAPAPAPVPVPVALSSDDDKDKDKDKEIQLLINNWKNCEDAKKELEEKLNKAKMKRKEYKKMLDTANEELNKLIKKNRKNIRLRDEAVEKILELNKLIKKNNRVRKYTPPASNSTPTFLGFIPGVNK